MLWYYDTAEFACAACARLLVINAANTIDPMFEVSSIRIGHHDVLAASPQTMLA